jgi:hypothetical protein
MDVRRFPTEPRQSNLSVQAWMNASPRETLQGCEGFLFFLLVMNNQEQKLPPASRSGSFLFAGPKRNEPKKKGLSPTELTGCIGLDGIFRQDIHVLSKNDWRPCQSPSGSGEGVVVLVEERKG